MNDGWQDVAGGREGFDSGKTRALPDRCRHAMRRGPGGLQRTTYGEWAERTRRLGTALDELGQTLVERAKQERRPERGVERARLLEEAAAWFERALQLDSEDLPAHYNLALIFAELGDPKRAALYQK